MKRPVVLVGTFPPPMHGMANVNDQMLGKVSRHADTRVINLAKGLDGTTVPSGLIKLKNTLSGLLKLLQLNRRAAMYIGLSGGMGQLFDLAFIVVAKMQGRAVFVHHHSYAYLSKSSKLFAFLLRIAGRRCTHIVLSEKMRHFLLERYDIPGSAVVLRNIVFVPGPGAVNVGRTTSSGAVVIGFLSNISFDKGIDVFFTTLSELVDRGIPFKAVIAGPFSSPEVESFVLEKMQEIDGVTYAGPVHDESKARFLAEVDVLLFPSRYRNEAQPLVIFEAQSSGAGVVATDVGSISEMIDSERDLLVSAGDRFATEAADYIGRFPDGEEDRSAFRRGVTQAFAATKQEESDQLDAILATITNS